MPAAQQANAAAAVAAVSTGYEGGRMKTEDQRSRAFSLQKARAKVRAAALALTGSD
jgi:hypothetical protein